MVRGYCLLASLLAVVARPYSTERRVCARMILFCCDAERVHALPADLPLGALATPVTRVALELLNMNAYPVQVRARRVRAAWHGSCPCPLACPPSSLPAATHVTGDYLEVSEGPSKSEATSAMRGKVTAFDIVSLSGLAVYLGVRRPSGSACARALSRRPRPSLALGPSASPERYLVDASTTTVSPRSPPYPAESARRSTHAQGLGPWPHCWQGLFILPVLSPPSPYTLRWPREDLRHLLQFVSTTSLCLSYLVGTHCGPSVGGRVRGLWGNRCILILRLSLRRRAWARLALLPRTSARPVSNAHPRGLLEEHA